MLTGGFVGEFGELANQFLEHRAHVGVADALWVQVDLAEFFAHLVQQAGLGQALHLSLEFEVLENIAHFG